jgi:PAS domain S-box-containing protein
MNEQDKRYKLLLIEDDQVDRMAFERFLKQNDRICQGETAASVAAAKAILSARKFDVVITDYHLGDGTAFDVIPMAKDTPVIFATGGGNEETAAQALKAGAYDYLVKDPEGGYLKILMLTVVRAMSRRRTEKEVRLLAEAVRSITDAVYVSTPDGDIVFVNDAFCRVYGYDAREALWENVSVLKSAGPEDAQVPWTGEAVHRRKDGSTFPADYRRTVLTDDGRPTFAVHVVRDITDKKKAEEDKERLIADLKEALSQVKKLSGLLPICASCKQIRDDKGGWKQIESYIADHSEANFTHGVCPDCTRKLYPEFADDLAKGR